MPGMRIAEGLDRPDGSVPPAEHESGRPPISVVVGVISLVAGTWWIEALEPAVEPSLTIESQSLGWFLFGLALIVGTLLGARIAWGMTLIFTALPSALVLSTAIDDPSAQTIGGLLLLAVALVCLALPSAQRFEHRRIRLVLV